MEKSIGWLEKLLTLQGLSASVSGSENGGEGVDADGSYWLTIDTSSLADEDVERLVGDRGRVLDSIQYLANITLNIGKEKDEQQAYTIEINGYRKKRQAELKAMAEEAAEKVLESGEEQTLKGLSSAERRHMHGLFGEYDKLETFSRGREPERHLVVKLSSDDSAESDSAEPDNAEPDNAELDEE